MSKLKKSIPIVFIMSLATIFADMAIDPYFTTRVGSCPPQFPNHLWELYNVLFSSTLAILLLKIFKIKFTVLDLMIALNIYLVMRGLLSFAIIYNYDFSWLDVAILSEYCGKAILLYMLNLLTLGFLFSEE